MRQDEQATGLLPDVEGLQELIRYLNISPEHHVVVYDDEGGAWAGRLIWNLHCLGFENTSLLNGGIHAWLAAGLPTTSEVEQFEPVSALVQVDQAKIQQYRIEYAELLEKVQSSQVQLWDCRTEDEYTACALQRDAAVTFQMHYILNGVLPLTVKII